MNYKKNLIKKFKLHQLYITI